MSGVVMHNPWEDWKAAHAEQCPVFGMLAKHGRYPGEHCRDCKQFYRAEIVVPGQFTRKMIKGKWVQRPKKIKEPRCYQYGLAHQKNRVWDGDWDACGLFERNPPPGSPLPKAAEEAEAGDAQ